MTGIKFIVVFTVAAFNLAVMSRSIGTYYILFVVTEKALNNIKKYKKTAGELITMLFVWNGKSLAHIVGNELVDIAV